VETAEDDEEEYRARYISEFRVQPYLEVTVGLLTAGAWLCGSAPSTGNIMVVNQKSWLHKQREVRTRLAPEYVLIANTCWSHDSWA